MGRYAIEAKATVLVEIEVDANCEAEAREKAAEWSCYESGVQSRTNFWDDVSDELVEEDFELDWEIMDLTDLNVESVKVLEAEVAP